MMLIDVKFKIGEIVYLKTDPHQDKRMIIGFLVTIKEIMYQIYDDNKNDCYYYDFEITRQKTYE